jgi:uncharacterized Zn-finger protein
MTTSQTAQTYKKKVSCDGGSGALGHPKIFLDIGDMKNIECPYCGKNFVLKKAS